MLVRNIVVAGMVSLLFAMQTQSDVILPNTHTIERCAYFDNLANFPDIAIVGGYTNMSSAKIERYIVRPDSCLYKGYRFGSFYLFWVTKTYLETQGLDKLPLESLVVKNLAKSKAVDGAAVPQMGLIPGSNDFFDEVVSDSVMVVKEKLRLSLSVHPSFGFVISSIMVSNVDKNGFERAYFIDYYHVGVKFRSTVSALPIGALRINSRLTSGHLIVNAGFDGKLTGELLDCRGCSIARFDRKVRTGATYVIPCSRTAAGLYWLHATDGASSVNLRLSTLE